MQNQTKKTFYFFNENTVPFFLEPELNTKISYEFNRYFLFSKGFVQNSNSDMNTFDYLPI